MCDGEESDRFLTGYTAHLCLIGRWSNLLIEKQIVVYRAWQTSSYPDSPSLVDMFSP